MYTQTLLKDGEIILTKSYKNDPATFPTLTAVAWVLLKELKPEHDWQLVNDVDLPEALK